MPVAARQLLDNDSESPVRWRPPQAARRRERGIVAKWLQYWQVDLVARKVLRTSRQPNVHPPRPPANIESSARTFPRLRFGLSWILLFACYVFCYAADDSARYRILVEQLTSARYEVREQAHAELLAAVGDTPSKELREALEGARNSLDVEQQLRARQILQEIRRRELWEPSRITLAKKDAPVLTLMADIASQSGNPVNWERTPKSLGDHRANADFDRQCYWNAIDDLCRSAKVSARFYDDPLRLGMVVVQGEPPEYPTAYAGPLRLQLTTARTTIEDTISFAEMIQDRQAELLLDFLLNWEQRCEVCRYGGRPRVVEAITETGEDLRVESKAITGEMPLTRRQRQVIFNARLRAPMTPATRIAKMRVELDLAIAGDFTSVETDCALHAPPVENDGYQLEFLELKPDGGGLWAIGMRWSRPLPYDKMNASDMADEYLEILDAAGAPISFNQFQVRGDKLAVEYLVHTQEKHGKPARLRYHFARQIGRKTVEFAYANIPLRLK